MMKKKNGKKWVAFATALVLSGSVFGSALHAEAASASVLRSSTSLKTTISQNIRNTVTKAMYAVRSYGEPEAVPVNIYSQKTRVDFVGQIVGRMNETAEGFLAESNIVGFGDDFNWCAAFVSYCLGNKVNQNYENKNRSVTEIYYAYKNAGRFHAVDSGYLPQIGDLVIYEESRNAEKFGYEHMGVVVKVDPLTGYYDVVEGNAFPWRVHRDGFSNSARMTFDSCEWYQASFNANIERMTGDRYNLDTFQKINGVYKGQTTAEWDYYNYATLPENIPSKRKVMYFNSYDVKYCFVVGFCSPVFKDDKQVELVRTVRKTGKYVRGDVNGDGVINSADIICMRSLLSEIMKDNTMYNTYSKAYGYSLYDINGNGYLNEFDYKELLKIFGY